MKYPLPGQVVYEVGVEPPRFAVLSALSIDQDEFKAFEVWALVVYQDNGQDDRVLAERLRSQYPDAATVEITLNDTLSQ